MTEDERENGYRLACEQMKDAQGENPSVFRIITDMSKKLLRLDGDEIRCRFDQMLRWREISFPFGQDIFTCAFLADYDLNRGFETKCFTWFPIIRSDNDRLNNILKEGIAENHFHLGGSTKIFELNWISLMNQIDGRLHDFSKINRTLQDHYADPYDVFGKRESFYAECQRAALYRVYLFSVIKENDFLTQKLEGIMCQLKKGAILEEFVQIYRMQSYWQKKCTGQGWTGAFSTILWKKAWSMKTQETAGSLPENENFYMTAFGIYLRIYFRRNKKIYFMHTWL